MITMAEIEYRYEMKFVISEATALMLKKQLRSVMELDSHSLSEDCSYLIRSCYFDDSYSSAYYDKIEGVEFRRKYRIRMYNNDPSFIKLECKHKDENMTYKQDCRITRQIAEAIMNGQYAKIRSSNGFMQQFLADAQANHLRPSIIVDYKRLAYTYPASEVRITFDEDLRSGRYDLNLFDPEMITFPMFPEKQLVLEVKCNNFIPDHILAILNSVPKIRQAVSKFAACRSIK